MTAPWCNLHIVATKDQRQANSTAARDARSCLAGTTAPARAADARNCTARRDTTPCRRSARRWGAWRGAIGGLQAGMGEIWRRCLFFNGNVGLLMWNGVCLGAAGPGRHAGTIMIADYLIAVVHASKGRCVARAQCAAVARARFADISVHTRSRITQRLIENQRLRMQSLHTAPSLATARRATTTCYKQNARGCAGRRPPPRRRAARSRRQRAA